MTYTVDRSQQLVEAHKHGRLAQKASLQAAGVPMPQHNVNAKKSAAKKTAKKTAKKVTAKKTSAKKSADKKTSKKS